MTMRSGSRFDQSGFGTFRFGIRGAGVFRVQRGALLHVLVGVAVAGVASTLVVTSNCRVERAVPLKTSVVVVAVGCGWPVADASGGFGTADGVSPRISSSVARSRLLRATPLSPFPSGL